jgi:hypothetical protein
MYLLSWTQCQCLQNSNMCICHHWHVSDDRYTYYYSDGIVSVITYAHITILMACHHWHNANAIIIVICVSLSLTQCQCHQNNNMCICYHWHNVIRIVIHVSVITDTMLMPHILLFWWHCYCASDDRYTHITILMTLALCQWWQIHILLFWWH